MNPARPGREQR